MVEPNKPAETPGLVAHGMLPVQMFVLHAIAQPPGTPARPRPDRPALPPTAEEPPPVSPPSADPPPEATPAD